VSRTRNADEFRTAFQQARSEYDRVFRRQIEAVRAQYDPISMERRRADLDESLEYHARCYVINAFLTALNWRLDLALEAGLPNLLPEAGVRSFASGTRRFLDYLGIEHHTNNPLLIVEAKRPSSRLPVLSSLPDIASGITNTSGVASAIVATEMDSVVISLGLAGEPLSGEWPTWLDDLRDYVGSVANQTGQAPRRVAITNGEWLVLFLDPTEALLAGGTPDSKSILVYRTADEIIQNGATLFSQLEHQRVLGETPPLRPVELPFHMQAHQIREAMHGLHLRYEQAQAIYHRAPMIHVAPIIFLRTDQDAWLRVEAIDGQYSIPHENERLSGHLEAVRAAGQGLLAEISNTLVLGLSASTIQGHFDDSDSFAVQKAVVKLPGDEYWVVTGEHTHYLTTEPSVPQCPHHDYGNSHTAGVAAEPGPIVRRSVDPRSFFCSRESHHCAHGNVALAKSQQVTPENRERCGSRSSRDGEAFCEIWSFERRLCCRTCAFELVCIKAQTFRLPCSPLVQIEKQFLDAAANSA
jgi:hypothetical protein